MPRRARFSLATALAVTLGVVLVVIFSGSHRSERRLIASRAFAGYLWYGRVTAMSAIWRVPNLTPSTLGSAATWIGAQSGGSSGPFIQVGIAEERQIPTDDVKLGLPSAGYRAYWYAFWSDTYHHFRLLPLAPVSPGDVVDASLRLVRGQWKVRLVDALSLLTVHFATRDEAQPLGTAEWLQEDVTNLKTSQLFRYPQLSAIRFRKLRVDGAPPSEAALAPESMSPNAKLTIVPSAVSDDGFTIPADR